MDPSAFKVVKVFQDNFELTDPRQISPSAPLTIALAEIAIPVPAFRFMEERIPTAFPSWRWGVQLSPAPGRSAWPRTTARRSLTPGYAAVSPTAGVREAGGAELRLCQDRRLEAWDPEVDEVEGLPVGYHHASSFTDGRLPRPRKPHDVADGDADASWSPF